jgi:hypothetical protein
MENDMSGELQVWQPSPFPEGSDLLPVELGNREVDTIGRENISAADMILPTFSCLQGMSDPVTQGAEGAKPGLFWLSGADEVFVGPVRLLLVAHTRSRALFPKPDVSAHAGLQACISRDGVEGTVYGACESCPHKDWGDNSPPACAESHNFVILTPMGPAVLRVSRTSYKAGRKLLTTWNMSSKPLWAHPCVVSSIKRERRLENGKTATFYAMDIRWLQREAVPPHVQAAARVLHDQVKSAHEQGRFGTDEDDQHAE